MFKRVFIGFDPPHPQAFAVCRQSVERLGWKERIYPIWRQRIEAAGLYRRPTSIRDGQLWDEISEAAMTTEFANARFFVPLLCGYEGFALFMDCDMLLSDYAPIGQLFRNAILDTSKAVWCVQHPAQDGGGEALKMDGKIQSYYQRKNWSSFMLFNCAHPSNQRLDIELLNEAPGRELHAFRWLGDDEIGELAPGWNWLVDVNERPAEIFNTHWTLGGPWIEKFRDAPDAERWHKAYLQWIVGNAHDAHHAGIQRAESEAAQRTA